MKRFRSNKPPRRARNRLRLERLERRELLAGDFRLSTDVNDDLSVDAVDALLVVNHLRRSRLAPVGSLAAVVPPIGDDAPIVDVNGDGAVQPIDALLVINQLRRGGVRAVIGLVEDTGGRDGVTNNVNVRGRIHDPSLLATGQALSVRRTSSLDIIDVHRVTLENADADGSVRFQTSRLPAVNFSYLDQTSGRLELVLHDEDLNDADLQAGGGEVVASIAYVGDKRGPSVEVVRDPDTGVLRTLRVSDPSGIDEASLEDLTIEWVDHEGNISPVQWTSVETRNQRGALLISSLTPSVLLQSGPSTSVTRSADDFQPAVASGGEYYLLSGELQDLAGNIRDVRPRRVPANISVDAIEAFAPAIFDFEMLRPDRGVLFEDRAGVRAGQPFTVASPVEPFFGPVFGPRSTYDGSSIETYILSGSTDELNRLNLTVRETAVSGQWIDSVGQPLADVAVLPDASNWTRWTYGGRLDIRSAGGFGPNQDQLWVQFFDTIDPADVSPSAATRSEVQQWTRLVSDDLIPPHGFGVYQIANVDGVSAVTRSTMAYFGQDARDVLPVGRFGADNNGTADDLPDEFWVLRPDGLGRHDALLGTETAFWSATQLAGAGAFGGELFPGGELAPGVELQLTHQFLTPASVWGSRIADAESIQNGVLAVRLAGGDQAIWVFLDDHTGEIVGRSPEATDMLEAALLADWFYDPDTRWIRQRWRDGSRYRAIDPQNDSILVDINDPTQIAGISVPPKRWATRGSSGRVPLVQPEFDPAPILETIQPITPPATEDFPSEPSAIKPLSPWTEAIVTGQNLREGDQVVFATDGQTMWDDGVFFAWRAAAPVAPGTVFMDLYDVNDNASQARIRIPSSAVDGTLNIRRSFDAPATPGPAVVIEPTIRLDGSALDELSRPNLSAVRFSGALQSIDRLIVDGEVVAGCVVEDELGGCRVHHPISTSGLPIDREVRWETANAAGVWRPDHLNVGVSTVTIDVQANVSSDGFQFERGTAMDSSVAEIAAGSSIELSIDGIDPLDGFVKHEVYFFDELPRDGVPRVWKAGSIHRWQDSDFRLTVDPPFSFGGGTLRVYSTVQTSSAVRYYTSDPVPLAVRPTVVGAAGDSMTAGGTVLLHGPRLAGATATIGGVDAMVRTLPAGDASISMDVLILTTPPNPGDGKISLTLPDGTLIGSAIRPWWGQSPTPSILGAESSFAGIPIIAPGSILEAILSVDDYSQIGVGDAIQGEYFTLDSNRRDTPEVIDGTIIERLADHRVRVRFQVPGELSFGSFRFGNAGPAHWIIQVESPSQRIAEIETNRFQSDTVTRVDVSTPIAGVPHRYLWGDRRAIINSDRRYGDGITLQPYSWSSPGETYRFTAEPQDASGFIYPWRSPLEPWYAGVRLDPEDQLGPAETPILFESDLLTVQYRSPLSMEPAAGAAAAWVQTLRPVFYETWPVDVPAVATLQAITLPESLTEIDDVILVSVGQNSDGSDRWHVISTNQRGPLQFPSNFSGKLRLGLTGPEVHVELAPSFGSWRSRTNTYTLRNFTIEDLRSGSEVRIGSTTLPITESEVLDGGIRLSDHAEVLRKARQSDPEAKLTIYSRGGLAVSEPVAVPPESHWGVPILHVDGVPVAIDRTVRKVSHDAILTFSQSFSDQNFRVRSPGINAVPENVQAPRPVASAPNLPGNFQPPYFLRHLRVSDIANPGQAIEIPISIDSDFSDFFDGLRLIVVEDR